MSRTPDFRVAALNKRTDEKATIGAAWKNEDGTIAVVLHSFTKIEGSKDILITLFPKDV